jgi:peptidoglycan/LPS O-acetylase OafA/YrhL
VNVATGITDPYVLEWGDNWAAVFARSFLTNADNFAVGMLAAVLIVAMQQDAVKEWLSRRVRLISALALLPVLMVVAVFIVMRSPYATSALGLLCAVLILAMVAPLARGEDSMIARWLETAPVLFVGKVSLSAYLWHFPVMLLLDRWGLLAGDTVQGMLYNVVVVLTATLLISTVTYYLVEKPVMDWTRQYRHRWA